MPLPLGSGDKYGQGRVAIVLDFGQHFGGRIGEDGENQHGYKRPNDFYAQMLMKIGGFWVLGASVGKNGVTHGAENDDADHNAYPQHNGMKRVNVLAHRGDAFAHVQIDGEHDLRNDQQQCAQAA